jgi:hypothetical protein
MGLSVSMIGPLLKVVGIFGTKTLSDHLVNEKDNL